MPKPSTLTDSHPSAFIGEVEVARLLGISESTLRGWRFKNVGPAYYKFAGAVRYDPAEVRDYIRQSRRTSTANKAA